MASRRAGHNRAWVSGLRKLRPPVVRRVESSARRPAAEQLSPLFPLRLIQPSRHFPPCSQVGETRFTDSGWKTLSLPRFITVPVKLNRLIHEGLDFLRCGECNPVARLLVADNIFAGATSLGKAARQLCLTSLGLLFLRRRRLLSGRLAMETTRAE